MIFKSKQMVNGNPIWTVDTDTQTVQHINPRTVETERRTFHTDQIKFVSIGGEMPKKTWYNAMSFQGIAVFIFKFSDFSLIFSKISRERSVSIRLGFNFPD